jgi:deoxyadenosine/deoxycytidine kinase
LRSPVSNDRSESQNRNESDNFSSPKMLSSLTGSLGAMTASGKHQLSTEDMPSNDSNPEQLPSSEAATWPANAPSASGADGGEELKPGPKTPRFIVVEGPLRVGKTTLAKILADRLHARRLYDCEDNPFLSDFYKEKPGSALRAQMYFLMERQKRIREALAAATPAPVLSDFLLEKDRIFANLNLDDEELKMYDRYYEALTAGIPAPDLVIYLQAKPEVLRARIEKKASREESEISVEYIEEVARAYEHFFFHYAASDLLVIDTSEIDFVEKSEDLQQLLRRLQDPVKGTQYFLPLNASE